MASFKNIIIVDDHELLIEGMRTMLENNTHYKVIEQYTDGNTFLDKGNIHNADLILIDISMPGSSGLEIIGKLREIYTDIPVIVVSQFTEEEYAVKALKVGANGYISKNSSKKIILKAVDTVLNGGMYITGAGIKTLYNNLENSMTAEALLEKLSNREHEVMLLLCRGKALKEISYELKISDRTVSTYKQRILEKLELNNLVDLIKFGIKNDIIN